MIACGNDVGTIALDYDTYYGKGATPTRGGAVLSGGFYLSPGWTLKPDLTLEWAQIVDSRYTGGDGMMRFNLPRTDAGWYSDAFPTDATNTRIGIAPAYPFTTPAALATPLLPPTLGFQDTPSRAFSGGNQFWQAELGLVAVNTVTDTVNVIETLQWGYSLTVPPYNGVATNTVVPSSPSVFGAPSSLYLQTENAFYSGMSPTVGGRTGVATSMYRFVNDPCVFVKTAAVPEPSSWVLVAIATGIGVTVAAARGEEASWRGRSGAPHSRRGPHYGCRYSSPPFITSLTFRRALMSTVGSPSTATRSASSPGLTAPRRSRTRWSSRPRRSRRERIGRLHAVFDQELELAGAVAMGEDAHVAAVGDGHARGQSLS